MANRELHAQVPAMSGIGGMEGFTETQVKVRSVPKLARNLSTTNDRLDAIAGVPDYGGLGNFRYTADLSYVDRAD